MTKTACRVGVGGVMLLATAVVTMFPVTVWGQIEEVVVTTRKKVENIQDVPIAVTAISTQEIERRGISDLAGVVKMSTSVQFDQAFGPQDTRIAVRGLSNTRGRSNVAFLVDGVDITTENFVSAGSGLLANQRLLNDVERIEIVKGPQSALYGRAAFAGAISYTMKEPGDEFESQLRLDAGDYGQFQLDGAVGGPVVGLEDVLGVRWTGAVWNHDGYYANRTTGQQMGDESGWGTALTAVLTPDADQNIKIKLRTEYSDSKIGQRPNVRVGGGTVGRGSGIGSDGLSFFPYPIDPSVIQGTSGTSTRLADFGEYCPDTFPDQGSPYGGICAPRGFGGASGLQPAVDVDPVTGADYKGTESELFRTTLNASIDYRYGTVTSITGWTDFNASDELDQDYQASPVGLDWKAHQQGRSQLETRQFSEELRFASSFDGPLNFTIGGLYWNEDRRQEDLNFIISCIEYGKLGDRVWPDPAAAITGVCDGTNGTIDNWQQRALDQFPCQYDSQGNPIPDPSGVGNCLQGPRTPAPWRAETNHWSAYFNLSWEITDTFELILENRYVNETFELLRPNFSSCTSLFFGFGTNPTSPGVREGQVNSAADDIVCTNEKRMNPNIPSGGNDLNLGDWMLVEGSEDSSFNTPKVTLNWRPTDTTMYYFSWGKGIKPGGINTLAAGGSPTTIDDERFKPEVVQAWEVGAKTDWELAGFLQLNGALFLNDYTDKQVGTQVVIGPDNVLQPRVVNAASAKVWGIELEATWQPEMVAGLVLSANYTYLDATYDQFHDMTRSMIRAANNGSCPVVYQKEGQTVAPNTPGAVPFCSLDMSGKKLERTPENAFTGNVQYTAPFMSSSIDWFVEGTVTYQDERFLDVDNTAKFDDYWLLDTRVGLQSERVEFLVYIDNVLDDDTIQTGGAGPDFGKQVTELGFTAGLGVQQTFAVLPDPRQVGARVTMRF